MMIITIIFSFKSEFYWAFSKKAFFEKNKITIKSNLLSQSRKSKPNKELEKNLRDLSWKAIQKNEKIFNLNKIEKKTWKL